MNCGLIIFLGRLVAIILLSFLVAYFLYLFLGTVFCLEWLKEIAPIFQQKREILDQAAKLLG